MHLRNLETNHLRIRPICEDDIQSFYRLSKEASLGQWIPDQVYSSYEEASSSIHFLISQYQHPLNPSKHPIVLAVSLKATGELIGHVGLSPLGGGVEIGYAIAEGQCGKGYATEAVTAVTHWALTEIKIAEILGVIARENVGSFRVLEKSGFNLESESETNYLGKLRVCRRYSIKIPTASAPL